MGLRSLLARSANATKQFAAAQLAARFPGLTLEALRQGWVPVPQSVLLAQLEPRIVGKRGVQTLRLECRPGVIHLELDIRRLLLVSQTIALDLACDELQLTRDTQRAIVTVQGDVEVRGRNLVGRLLAGLVEGIVVEALGSKDSAQGTHEATDGTVELRWPEVVVHLNRSPDVRALLESQVLGVRLLDVVRLGPLEVCEGHVRLQVRRTEKGRAGVKD